MSRRERPAQRLADPAPKPSRGGTPSAAGSSSRMAPAADHLDWDKFIQSVSPSQRQELLALAREQGLLYSFQLPSTVNGSHNEPNPGAFAMSSRSPSRMSSLTRRSARQSPGRYRHLTFVLCKDWLERASRASLRK
jgi:hypothetical protein